MKLIPRKSLISLVIGLIVLMTFVSLPGVPPAQADIGVRPILPGGSDIKPEGETPIQMASERVVMTVRPATEADNTAIQLNPQAYGLQIDPIWYPAVVEVEADFSMHNPTGEPVSMTVWFPLASALENVSWELNPEEIVPRIENFQVVVNGSPLDPTIGELPNPQGEDKPPLPWASFPVTFPAGKETNIQVSYSLPLHQAVKGKELALYYIFQTGSGWSGPIGRAELVVDLPYPASEETLAGMPPGSFNLPYFISTTQVDLPPGGVLDGNQARWTWEAFEPGPEDDFAIWLMEPAEWQELETARAAVQADPQDGQAWLELALIYQSLATSGYNSPSVFSRSYAEPGLEAYRNAAELLPEHPAPHAGLALLSLAPYMRGKDAPPEVIQLVQDELKTARDLEDSNPSLAEESGVSSMMVEEVLEIYAYNEATATAEAAYWAADQATQTAAVAGTATPVPTTALAQATTLTPSPASTNPPQPKPVVTQAATPTTATFQPFLSRTGFGLTTCVVLAGGLVFLVIMVFLFVRGRHSR